MNRRRKWHIPFSNTTRPHSRQSRSLSSAPGVNVWWKIPGTSRQLGEKSRLTLARISTKGANERSYGKEERKGIPFPRRESSRIHRADLRRHGRWWSTREHASVHANTLRYPRIGLNESCTKCGLFRSPGKACRWISRGDEGAAIRDYAYIYHALTRLTLPPLFTSNDSRKLRRYRDCHESPLFPRYRAPILYHARCFVIVPALIYY